MVFVSIPLTSGVGEGDGRVEVCATLSDAAVATERDFMITLATSDGTALGKYRSYIIYLKLIFTLCYSWV